MTSDQVRLLTAFAIAALLARRGLSRKSLSPSGAIAAFTVGLLSWASSVRFGTTLIIFYLAGTSATRFKASLKAKLEDGYTHAGGNRSAAQVFASSLPAVIVAVLYYVVFRYDAPVTAAFPMRSTLLLMFELFFAACAGDTFASELGLVLPGAGRQPVLIVKPWKRVPRGTNGGVSLEGNLGSALGGFVVGSCYFLTGGEWSFSQLWLVVVGVLGGVLGSLVDSVLGAVVQASWLDVESGKVLKETPKEKGGRYKHICGMDLMGGEMVNVMSATMTMCFAPLFVPLFQTRFPDIL